MQKRAIILLIFASLLFNFHCAINRANYGFVYQTELLPFDWLSYIWVVDDITISKIDTELVNYGSKEEYLVVLKPGEYGLTLICDTTTTEWNTQVETIYTEPGKVYSLHYISASVGWKAISSASFVPVFQPDTDPYFDRTLYARARENWVQLKNQMAKNMSHKQLERADGSKLQISPQKGISMLVNAAEKGDLSSIKKLISEGIYINQRSEVKGEEWTPLEKAVANGHLGIVKYLVEKGAKVNFGSSDTRPIGYAVEKGYVDIIKYLLEHNADPNCTHSYRDERGWAVYETPVLIAVKKRDMEILKYLTQYGADVNRDSPPKHEYPLGVAAYEGHLDIVQYLLENGADINRCHGGRTALWFAAKQGYFDIVKLLVSKGADVNLDCMDGLTPLAEAAGVGHFNIVKFLVENGADLNAVEDRKKGSAIIFALENEHYEIVKFLADNGSKLINEESIYDWSTRILSALDRAFEKKNDELIEYFLKKIEMSDNLFLTALAYKRYDIVRRCVENGVDVNTKLNSYYDGKYPIHVALIRDEYDLFYYFVDHGADLNVFDDSGFIISDGKTPLMYAASDSNYTLAQYLIQHGADVNILSEEEIREWSLSSWEKKLYRTALMYSAISGMHQIAELLLKHGAEIDKQDKRGYTALAFAAENNHLQMVKLLVKHNANLNLKTSTGKTALDIAKENNLNEIYDFLKKSNITD